MTVIAFAANSVLNRAALEANFIDPYLFSLIRIGSGALVFVVVLFVRGQLNQRIFKTWRPSVYLTLYVFCFSAAYAYVSSATGALILFATVQFVMIGSSYLNGNRLDLREWLGIVVTAIGFLVLLVPGVHRPPLWGAFLMIASGIGWAMFSLSGLQSKNAVLEVGRGFIFATPFALLTAFLFVGQWHANWAGVGLALASGILASGFGYCVWYLMLPLIAGATAAVFQLLVPVVVALMGIVILNESITPQFVIASILVMAGLAWYSRARFKKVTD